MKVTVSGGKNDPSVYDVKPSPAASKVVRSVRERGGIGVVIDEENRGWWFRMAGLHCVAARRRRKWLMSIGNEVVVCYGFYGG